MLKYMKDVVDTYFDISITNEDPISSVGPQTIVLKDVNLDECPMAMLDIETEALNVERFLFLKDRK